jgi:hypothetical protein
MKKFTLLFASFIMVTWVAQSQEVARNMVVVEIGTGTWTSYCVGSAMGADELVANGKSVAIIQNHNTDTYANTYSNLRNSYYGIAGYPTAIFDGGSKVVGGNSTSSMYPNYLAKYDLAIKIKSPVQIDYTVTRTGQQFIWDFVITKVLTTLTSNQLVFHFVVTQSHIQQAWQGQTQLNFVTRLMIPDQNGTALDFSTGGDVKNVHIVANIDPLWPLEDIEFVGFVQDNANKKILNAMRPTCSTCVGLNEAEKSNLFSVYPNPASDAMNISFNTGTPEVLKLKMINSLGNVVYTEILSTTGKVNHSINVGVLAKGMYLLNVQGENLNSSQKVIVQH